MKSIFAEKFRKFALRLLSICWSGHPKRTGSGQFKWKGPRCARTFFDTTWPTGAGELSGSDPAGPFRPEAVLRTRAFHLRTNQNQNIL